MARTVFRNPTVGTILTLLLLGCASGPVAAQAPPTPSTGSPPPPVRTIYLVRHGAYDTADERPDSVGRGLTPLGIAQCRLIGNRLRSLPVTMTHLYSSRLTRARESARVIAADFPTLTAEPSPLLNECTPPTWRQDVMAENDSLEVLACRDQLEAAWKRFVVPATDRGENDILVCHGNVIRYFVTKALNVDTMAWLQMGLANASLTVLQVRPDSTVRMLGFADNGHLPPNMITGIDRTTRDLVVPADTPGSSGPERTAMPCWPDYAWPAGTSSTIVSVLYGPRA